MNRFLLRPQLVPVWPKLAWVATLRPGQREIQVLHGPMVEAGDGWIAEAVWAGDFKDGDFDRTDLVFGTGIRCRGERTTFVSSGSTLDRLCYARASGEWHVSNSLGALLACSELDFRDDYDYSEDLRSICRGLKDYVRSLPASVGEIRVVYFNNLVWDGRSIREAVKPDSCPTFSDFTGYRDFLERIARRIADNARAPQRRQGVELLTTITSGYDSVATAVIASQAGCRQAVTIRQSTSLWRGSDSGEHIAAILGLRCRAYNRECRSYPYEETIWAVAGRPGVLNWTQFDYPEPLCCFFTGCHGDKVWERDDKVLSDPFLIPSIADLGIGDFRLVKGVFHCPVPFWGMRHIGGLHAITFREEMKPWTVGRKTYDRPIARRIIEEAGVPRGAFAVRKKNTSHEAEFLWPYSAEAKKRFAKFLRDRGIHVPRALGLWLIRRLAHVENLLHINLLAKMRFRRRLRPWNRVAGSKLIFQWANVELKKLYQNGLLGSLLGSSCQPATRTESFGAQVFTQPEQVEEQVGQDVARATGTYVERGTVKDPASPCVIAGRPNPFRLKPRIVPAWPKLAWVAVFAEGAETIDVYHGPMVETGDGWIAEAVWAGDFSDGDFDRTDLVFGTGIRCRGDYVAFVTSGTTFDRLWYSLGVSTFFVSNSLAALLAACGLSLRDDYPCYSRDLYSVTNGLHTYEREIVTTGAPIRNIVYSNLRYDRHGFSELGKPDRTPQLSDFHVYRSFLFETADYLKRNMTAPERSHRVVPLATLSTGYDSSAAAVIAKRAGCRRAASIRHSSSVWRGSDSGEETARFLGLDCVVYDKRGQDFPFERTIWAATGRPSELDLTVFDYPEPLCTLFTGHHGDKIWDRTEADLSDPFGHAGFSGRGLCEFRLHRGFFHCPVPFWGYCHAAEIQRISRSPEMSPWTLCRHYDRPIPRRLVEEEGVPRDKFGMRKKVVQFPQYFIWPYSRDAEIGFRRYLAERHVYAPAGWLVRVYRRVALLDALVYENILKKLGLRRGARPWASINGSSQLFQWANEELKQRYLAGLRDVQAEMPAASEVSGS